MTAGARWRQLLSENIAKAIFCVLIAWGAIHLPSFLSAAVAFLATLAGILVPVVVASTIRPRSTRQRPPIAVLLLTGLVDHSRSIFIGALGALVVSLVLQGMGVFDLVVALIMGAVLGLVVYVGFRIRRAFYRRLVSVAVALAIAVAVGLLSSDEWIVPAGAPLVVASWLLSMSLVYYILIFAGRSEESELDIALVCLGIGLAMGALRGPPTIRSAVVLLPLGLYVVYCERARRGVIVFKHVLRAIEAERLGNLRQALVSYRLAHEQDPRSTLAGDGYWKLHRRLDAAMLAQDAELARLVDPDACLNRVEETLRKSADRAKFDEARDLARLVHRFFPSHQLAARASEAKVLLAQGHFDEAADLAQSVLREFRQIGLLSPGGQQALASFWNLMLREGSLAARGLQLLAEPGIRVACLALIESLLQQNPKDAWASEFRPFIYRQLTLGDLEFVSAEAAAMIDRRFCRQCALDMEADGEAPAGQILELLQVAAEGLPNEQIVVWRDIARILAKDDASQALDWRHKIVALGVERGLANLTNEERSAVTESSRVLAEHAEEAGDLDDAQHFWEIYVALHAGGTATLERLRKIHEQRSDLLSAIKQVTRALAFELSKSDKDAWLQHRDRLYSAVTASDLQPRLQESASYFDFNYCQREAQRLFEAKADPERVQHYLDLAALEGVDRLLEVNALLGRLRLREGDYANAALCFEQGIQTKPKRFRDDEQRKAYERSCRLLGQIALEQLNDPEKAIHYLSIYKDAEGSGADTLYLLAQAYERAGNLRQAMKWYDMVLVYPSHPRAQAAKESLDRLRRADAPRKPRTETP